jgi:predicted ABC-type transport system involved in lysophospholipase L1 biosynthesis ATPase subunit
VRCQGVEKTFGQGEAGVRVLRGVDFEARSGELTFLVGPSGCGKTTLISLIAGLLDASAGRIEVLGSNPSEFPAEDRILFRRRNLGFVFQQYNLLTSLTAAENAAVPLLAAGVRRRDAVEQGRALLNQLGLGSRTHALPREHHRRGRHGTARPIRAPPGPRRHRRDPRQPRLPPRRRHRPHGRRPHHPHRNLFLTHPSSPCPCSCSCSDSCSHSHPRSRAIP